MNFEFAVLLGEAKQGTVQSEPQHDMHTRSQASTSTSNRLHNQRNTRQATQTTNYSSNGVAQLQDEIAELKNELSKQAHRYKFLSGTVRRLKSDKKKLEEKKKASKKFTRAENASTTI
jgi:chromosome segregation ATPase